MFEVFDFYIFTNWYSKSCALLILTQSVFLPPAPSPHPSFCLGASARFNPLEKNDLKEFRKIAVDLTMLWNQAHELSDELPTEDHGKGKGSRLRRKTVLPNMGGGAGSGGAAGMGRVGGGRSSSSGSGSSSKEMIRIKQENQKLQNKLNSKLVAEKKRKKLKKESKYAKKQRSTGSPSPSPPPAAPSPPVSQMMSDGARLAVSALAQGQASLLGDLARISAQGGNMVAAQSFAAGAGVSTGIAMDIVGNGVLPVSILPAP